MLLEQTEGSLNGLRFRIKRTVYEIWFFDVTVESDRQTVDVESPGIQREI